MTLTLGSKLGSYEVQSLLGAGGMGEVYRARDTRLGREVAIKVLPADRMADESRRRRFVQEARAASALDHPNIVTIHEIESVEGFDFIVMEYVSGNGLDALIPRQGMRLGDVLRTAIPMADALARAHARGIVHRDLKPANVMVSGEGVVKVLDFGLAKLVSSEEPSDDRETVTKDTAATPLSRPGTVAGTAAYMSPEQATAGKVDSRSDVFAFGAVLYEMVTGQRAFAGNSTAETLAAVVRDKPKVPSEIAPSVPRDLEKVILRCLCKEPDRRFQHMLDVKLDLEQIKEESDSGRAQSCSVALSRSRRSTGVDRRRLAPLAVPGGRRPSTDGCPPYVHPRSGNEPHVLARRRPGGVRVAGGEAGQLGHLPQDDRVPGDPSAHDGPHAGLRSELLASQSAFGPSMYESEASASSPCRGARPARSRPQARRPTTRTRPSHPTGTTWPTHRAARTSHAISTSSSWAPTTRRRAMPDV